MNPEHQSRPSAPAGMPVRTDASGKPPAPADPAAARAAPDQPASDRPTPDQPASAQPGADQHGTDRAGPIPTRPGTARPLNRPLRWLVAAAELAAAAGFAVLAVWAWHRATIPVQLPEYDNPALPRSVNRVSGPWAGATVAAATVAGLLVLDAVREVVLAARAEHQASGPADETLGDGPPAEDVESRQ